MQRAAHIFLLEYIATMFYCYSCHTFRSRATKTGTVFSSVTKAPDSRFFFHSFGQVK